MIDRNKLGRREEVWLRAYEAAIRNLDRGKHSGTLPYAQIADDALSAFDKTFPVEDETR